MVRVVEMEYRNGRIRALLCFDYDQCYNTEYLVLEKEEFEERLAKVIGEANASALISYEKGDLPEEP